MNLIYNKLLSGVILFRVILYIYIYIYSSVSLSYEYYCPHAATCSHQIYKAYGTTT